MLAGYLERWMLHNPDGEGRTQMSTEARTEIEKPRPLTMEIDQVKQIYDYTKFHIGLYSTLLTGLVAVVTFSKGKDFGQDFRKVILVIIIRLLIGGIAGALAASRIVYGPWQEHQFAIEESRFWKKRWMWPRKSKWKSWWGWADISLAIEHYAFWLAALGASAL
jgi:hypothetical protein